MDATRTRYPLALCALLLTTGCANWQPTWQWPGQQAPQAQNPRVSTYPPQTVPVEDFDSTAKVAEPADEQDDVIAWTKGLPSARASRRPADDWASAPARPESWASSETPAQPGYQQYEPPPYGYDEAPAYDAAGRPYRQQPDYAEPAPGGSYAAAPTARSNFGPLEQPGAIDAGQTRLASDQQVTFDFSRQDPPPVHQQTTPPETSQAMQPPRIGAVQVRPMAAGRVAAPLAQPNRGVRVQPGSLEELVDRVATESADASFREQLQRRVLHALAGNDDEARRPVQLYSAEKQELVASFVEMLIYLRDVPNGELTASEGAARSAIDRVVQSLRQVSGVRIPKFVLCNRVNSFGQYQPIDPPDFPAGRPVEFVAYTEVADWASQRTTGGGYRSVFGLKIEVFDAGGTPVHVENAEAIEDVCQTRRRDCFIAPLVRLPGSLSPGDYVVKVTLTDTIGKQFAQSRARIRVVGRS